MRRMRTLAAMTVGALLYSAVPVMANESTLTGAVTSVAIVPSSSGADVLIAIAGAVEVQDFVLGAPKHRIVLDFTGATLRGGPKLYDKVVRAGIKDIRVGQTDKNKVRVVLELDAARDYTLIREENGVRVSVSAPGSRFTAWGTAGTSAPVAEAAVAMTASPTMSQVSATSRAAMMQQSQ